MSPPRPRNTRGSRNSAVAAGSWRGTLFDEVVDRQAMPLIPQLDHTAIGASAGSGKTHQLTNRYLQLIAANAEPSSILASTFTRLAAGQIRDKILLRLANAALEPGAATLNDLAMELEVPALSRGEVLGMLAMLARRMHLMQVRTLDSFFASIVRAFAIELDLPLGAEVVDENQATAMRHEAMRLMLDERDPQQLVELLRLLTQGRSDRGVTDSIDRTVRDLYALYLEAPLQAWECVPRIEGRLDPPQLVMAIQRLDSAPCAGNPQLVKAHRKSCGLAREWNWVEFLGGGLAKAIAGGSGTYARKTIDADLAAAYEPLVRHAIAELIGRVRDQTIATRDLLALFDRQYQSVKHARGALTFGDLTAAMGRARSLGKMDDIGFRLDAKLRHLLLDEFQDTSVAQWRALEPIVREIVSVRPPERSFFCVGDVKQSIYGWRDAAPEVLEELPTLLQGPDGTSAITQRRLSKSYRSSPVVMKAVNLVFENLAATEALHDYADAASAWSKGFQRHQTAKEHVPGYVDLRECRRVGPDESAFEVRLRQAAELAADLHRRDPAMSIGLLTRTNRTVARLLYELGPGPGRLDVRASGRGGGPLTDAAPVNVILDLLHLADHPDDTIAAFNIAASPAGAGVGLADYGDSAARRKLARSIRRRLLDDGYGATVGSLVEQMASACDQRELRRLLQLVDLAEAHDSRPSLRTANFIAAVEHTPVADTQPAAVQAMTIHQSKGLEFDAVILADLEMPLSGSAGGGAGGGGGGWGAPPVVFERAGAGQTGPITRICRYMRDDLVDFVPQLRPLFDRYRQRCVRESLSLLYVAMTRAISGLYMLIDPPEIKKDGKASKRSLTRLAGVVRCALAGEATAAEPGAPIFTTGNPGWVEARIAVRGSVTAGVDAPAVAQIELAPPGPLNGIRGWAQQAASSLHAPTGGRRGRSAGLASQMQLPDSEARQRGIALHALFEQVEWIEDFNRPDHELAAIVRRCAPRQDDAWVRAQITSFRAMLTKAQIRKSLSRAGIDRSQVQVQREWRFARLLDGKLQNGCIDRLTVALDDAGRPVSGAVLDFKTDQLEGSQVRRTLELYRPQLEAYQSVAAEQTGVPPGQIAMHILHLPTATLIDL